MPTITDKIREDRFIPEVPAAVPLGDQRLFGARSRPQAVGVASGLEHAQIISRGGYQ